MENLKFMVVLCVYTGFGGQELETTLKTKKTHQKPRQTTKTTVKTTVKTKKNLKNHHFQPISQNPEFVVLLGFYSGFGGLSWFLVVFLGFYSGF